MTPSLRIYSMIGLAGLFAAMSFSVFGGDLTQGWTPAHMLLVAGYGLFLLGLVGSTLSFGRTILASNRRS